jgi:hypothetical protein
MKQKFVIVAHDLKSHCDQDFDATIAIAEAARRADLQPVLGIHVDGRTDQFPAWLETHACFLPFSEAECSIAGRRDRVKLRVNREALSGAPEEASLSRMRRLGRRICTKTWWLFERGVFYLLPPFVYDGAKRACAAVPLLVVPRILRRKDRQRAAYRVRDILHRKLHSDLPAPIDFSMLGPESARSMADQAEGPLTTAIFNSLSALNEATELERALHFKRELAGLLAHHEVGPGDQVLLCASHAREKLAVQLVSMLFAPERRPDFHLMFRDGLLAPGEATTRAGSGTTAVQKELALLAPREQNQAMDAVKLYADTEELARDYSRASGLRFGVLPLPVRGPSAAKLRAPTQALELAFLGKALDEKGFHWLPHLIDRLMDDYVRPGRVRFLIQATVGVPRSNPLSVLALARLKNHSPHHVELFGLTSTLPLHEYDDLASRADIVLLPYDQKRRGAGSSRILADAIARGRPAIVPASSWMSAQIPLGAGETFHDFETFVQAVRRVVEDYEAYRTEAELWQSDWLASHSADELVAAVTCRPRTEAARLQLAA